MYVTLLRDAARRLAWIDAQLFRLVCEPLIRSVRSVTLWGRKAMKTVMTHLQMIS